MLISTDVSYKTGIEQDLYRQQRGEDNRLGGIIR